MIHKLTDIHPDAKIGNNVTIEAFTTIYADVEIGEGTWIGPNVTIMDGARIGKNCKIFPGAVISAVPQDLKFDGEKTTVEVGDNTTIRECVTLNRGTKAKWKTSVGSNCLIMAYVHLAHDVAVGNNCILVNGVGVAGEVEIGDWAIIGGMTAIHQFSKIGEHSFISGGSLVRKDIPPFAKAAHEPLSYVGLNSLGLRRRGFNADKVAEIQEIYRIIYQKGMNHSQALQYIEENMPKTDERDLIVNFVRSSKRGIMKGYAAGKKSEDTD